MDGVPERQSPSTGVVEKCVNVPDVCRQWLVREDAALAGQLQNAEFKSKYNRNLSERQIARKDVPLARKTHDDEEERLQRERLKLLADLKAVADHDALVAQQLQSQEMISDEQARLHLEMTDEELARSLQEKEKRRYKLKLQERELRHRRKLLERELHLQELDRCRDDGDINAHERTWCVNNCVTDNSDQYDHVNHRDIDEWTNGDNEHNPIGNIHTDHSRDAAHRHRDRRSVKDLQIVSKELSELSVAGTGKERRLRCDGKVEDSGDFTDFYVAPPDDMPENLRNELQRRQDEELARLLQEQEHKRGGQVVNRDKLKEIEEHDAELARMIYEQERLARHQKRKNRNKDPTSDPSTEPSLQEMINHEALSHNDTYLPTDTRQNSSDSNYSNIRLGDRRPEHTSPTNSYASRPLPDTPSIECTRAPPKGYNMSLMRALDHSENHESAEHASEQRSRANDSNIRDIVMAREIENANRRWVSESHHSADVDKRHTDENVFLAIDPTCRVEAKRLGSSPRQQAARPLNPPLSATSSLPLAQSSPRDSGNSFEDSYCDLEDVRIKAALQTQDNADLAPVQGQRRHNMPNKDSTRDPGVCKQQ